MEDRQHEEQERRIDDAAALPEEELKKVIAELCQSKAEEFLLLGYENITGEDIWQCVSNKYNKGLPRLHRVVNDILSLKTTEYMNWLTMNVVYKGVRI